MRKDRWTESEVLSLPSGENDRLERKSGALLNDPDVLKKLDKVPHVRKLRRVKATENRQCKTRLFSAYKLSMSLARINFSRMRL
jgi:hypothetical protein